MIRNPHTIRAGGYLMVTALVFGAVLLGVITALSGFVLAQNKLETVATGRSEGLSLAEAGLEYYLWHLALYPTDLENGTGKPGPYTLTFPDPETGVSAGTATLSISGQTSCGQITSVNITSKGVPNDQTGGYTTLVGQYAEPTVALYSYILNADVWAGSDRVINGPYHSNGGIRMDGTANAPVTSSLSSWTCTATFGCDGIGGDPANNATEPGIFGAGPNQTLWSYPTPQVDFTAIEANFSSLKTTAESSGLYFPRISSGTSGSNAGEGYHLVFNSNGTVTVYKVTKETDEPSIPIDNPSDTSLQPDYTLISTQSASTYSGYNDGLPSSGTYTIPSGCGLIFVEDNTWIEGTIPKEVTVVAANVTNPGVTPDIMLPNNITYSNPSGTSGLTAISSNDILITPNSPTNMTLDGIFVAQGGAFGRNMYTCTEGSYANEGTLTIHGSTVSNLRTGTQWTYPGSSYGCGGNSGTETSGYSSRIDAFDRQLSTNPPPFTSVTSPVYQIVDWRQQQ